MRIASLAMAVIAGLLVIMAGKSCTEDAKIKSKTPPLRTPEYVQQTPTAGNVDSQKNNSADQVSAEEETTSAEQSLQYVYDEEGNVVGAVYPDGTVVDVVTVTDENGEIVEQYIPETEVETETRSVLEQYHEDKEQNGNNKISGFNHSDKSESKVKSYENATIPSDFSIVLD